MDSATFRRQTRWLRVLVLTVLPVIATTGLIIPAQASVTSQAGALAPSVADSSTLATPAVAAGHLAEPDGLPIVGQDVVLYALPSRAVTERKQVNQVTPWLAISQARTARSGAFVLRLANVAGLATSSDANGIVNFAIYTADKSGFAINYFSRAVHLGRGALSSNSVVEDSEFATVTSQPHLSSLVMRAQAGSARSDSALQPDLPTGCAAWKVQSYKPVWFVAGGSYSSTAGVTAQFTYTAGSSSSLGVGISVSGAVGSFSEEGTQSMSSSTTVGYGARANAQNVRYLSTVAYERDEVECRTGHYVHHHYQSVPAEFTAGSNVVKTGSPPATYCSPESAGNFLTESSTSAFEFSARASMSQYLGIDLSTQTGFTKTASITYTWSRAIHLCGSNAYPGSSRTAPQRLSARP